VLSAGSFASVRDIGCSCALPIPHGQASHTTGCTDRGTAIVLPPRSMSRSPVSTTAFSWSTAKNRKSRRFSPFAVQGRPRKVLIFICVNTIFPYAAEQRHFSGRTEEINGRTAELQRNLSVRIPDSLGSRTSRDNALRACPGPPLSGDCASASHPVSPGRRRRQRNLDVDLTCGNLPMRLLVS
jgi:hypothetical protein